MSAHAPAAGRRRRKSRTTPATALAVVVIGVADRTAAGQLPLVPVLWVAGILIAPVLVVAILRFIVRRIVYPMLRYCVAWLLMALIREYVRYAAPELGDDLGKVSDPDAPFRKWLDAPATVPATVRRRASGLPAGVRR